MGRVLTWAPTWAMSGLGPQNRPWRLIEGGALMLVNLLDK